MAGLIAGLLLAAASSASATSAPSSRSRLRVVAAENMWGSIARQLGGSRVEVASIISNPNADPHAYEPTVADARSMADAQYVIVNGAGYDAWAQKLLAANPVKGRRELDVGALNRKHEGDNPHLWYSPSAVARVARQITKDYQRLDRQDAAYFGRQYSHFVKAALGAYHREIALIAQRYRGVPVGATESVFEYLAQALGLKLITPSGFMKAISEGTEPTAQDRAAFSEQISHRQIKVLVYNSQNATPDTTALEDKAKQEHIPTVAITETLQPATASFQAWQTAQLRSLRAALHRATGR